MGERCRVCGVGRVGDRALARGTKKWVRTSTHSINLLEFLERPAPRRCQGSRRLGVAVAVDSGSGAAGGPGGDLGVAGVGLVNRLYMRVAGGLERRRGWL